MKTTQRIATALATVALGLLAGGCTAESAQSSEDAPTLDALSASKVQLPKGDACRDVLGPLALAVADGAYGLAYTKSITVSKVGEADTRAYTVQATGADSLLRYDVELDNDSASRCLLLAVSVNQTAKLGRDRRSAAKGAELRVSAPISVTPAGDDCRSTVKLLAQAAAVSAVGASYVQNVDVRLVGETDDRDYEAHVDGQPFVANGRSFANDYDFTFNLSNDSASKCLVQGIGRK
ncbi:MAG: hypothetical protein HOO96_12390 [Polyangiaceae bacterium]|nr:hypothetical protein [Polyangiaceae bacterium]